VSLIWCHNSNKCLAYKLINIYSFNARLRQILAQNISPHKRWSKCISSLQALGTEVRIQIQSVAADKFRLVLTVNGTKVYWLIATRWRKFVCSFVRPCSTLRFLLHPLKRSPLPRINSNTWCFNVLSVFGHNLYANDLLICYQMLLQPLPWPNKFLVSDIIDKMAKRIMFLAKCLRQLRAVTPTDPVVICLGIISNLNWPRILFHSREFLTYCAMTNAVNRGGLKISFGRYSISFTQNVSFL